jgi:transcriptional regulator with XRE-family HTH domain
MIAFALQELECSMNSPAGRRPTPERATKAVVRRIQQKTLAEHMGRNLLIAREALGVTRQEWVRKYDLYPSKYSQWENGIIPPNLLFLVAICEDYGLTMDWFVRGVRAGVASSVSEALKGVSAENSPALLVEDRPLLEIE